jgi:hypothetical protein
MFWNCSGTSIRERKTTASIPELLLLFHSNIGRVRELLNIFLIFGTSLCKWERCLQGRSGLCRWLTWLCQGHIVSSARCRRRPLAQAYDDGNRSCADGWRLLVPRMFPVVSRSRATSVHAPVSDVCTCRSPISTGSAHVHGPFTNSPTLPRATR